MNSGRLGLNIATSVAALVAVVAGLSTIESVVDVTDIIPEHERLAVGILAGVITIGSSYFFRSLLEAQKFSREVGIRSL